MTSRIPFPSLSPDRQIQVLFFLSGMSALILEVLYVRLIRYWTGNTAAAVAVVLTAYMAGLALGSFAAGRWLVVRRNLLIFYGALELLVGVYSLGFPYMSKALMPTYLYLTMGLGADGPSRLAANFMVGVILLLWPTLAMGASFPLVVRAWSAASADRPERAEKLYTVNLAGAALGALLSDFFLVRAWGLGNSLFFVGAVNFGLALWAARLQKWLPQPHPPAAPLSVPAATPPHPARQRAILSLAFVGGFLVLFQELVWTHMVGQFLDNSAYGFAITLFMVIAGLGLGALLVTRSAEKKSAPVVLPWICLGAGFFLLGLIPFWDNARLLTTQYPLWSVYVATIVIGAGALILSPLPKTLAYVMGIFPTLVLAALLYRALDPAGARFWVHHSVDLSVSILFMFAPAVLMGMVFPLVLDWRLRSTGRSVAAPYAVNTLGSLAGIIVATFVALPALGVEVSGRLAGLGFVLLAALLLIGEREQRSLAVVAVAVSIAAAVWLPRWDIRKSHRALGHPGELVFAKEDLNGGLVTVLRQINSYRLYMNGLFEASDDFEVHTQARCALVPLLYTREFDRALAIGVGSGQTAGLLSLYPFRRIQLVDYSARAVEAARSFFGHLHYGVFDDPRVAVNIQDGRHYLVTHPEKYSLLTIEVSRLWVAGEGDLYTHEFYETCATRLTDHGILQQWVPLFQLSISDTLIILRTVRQVFPHVTLYMGPESGMIVASRSPLVIEYATLQQAESKPQIKDVLSRMHAENIYSLLGDCVLLPQGLDELLSRVDDRRISTDLWPYLEHSNARYYHSTRSSAELRRFLLSAQEFRLPVLHGATPLEKEEVEAAALRQRRRHLEAVRMQ